MLPFASGVNRFFSLPAKFLFCLCFKNRPSSRNRNVAGRPPFVNTLRPKSFTFVAKGRLKLRSHRAAGPKRHTSEPPTRVPPFFFTIS